MATARSLQSLLQSTKPEISLSFWPRTVNASARETLLLSLCGTSTEAQTQHVVSKRLGSNPCAIHIPSRDGVANRSRSSSPVPYAVSLINAVGDDCARCEIDNSC